MRAEVPVALLPAHGRRVERGAGAPPRAPAARRGSSSPASTRPVAPSRSTSRAAPRRGRRACPRGSSRSTSAGRSRSRARTRRASGARAPPAPAPGRAARPGRPARPPSVPSGTGRCVQLPRGRPRTSFASIASWGRTRSRRALASSPTSCPSPKWSFVASRGTLAREVARERLAARLERSERRLAPPRRASQVAGRSAMPACSDQLLVAACAARGRSPRVQAAWTTARELAREDEQRPAHADHADERCAPRRARARSPPASSRVVRARARDR